jgi:hypothetical protein
MGRIGRFFKKVSQWENNRDGKQASFLGGKGLGF